MHTPKRAAIAVVAALTLGASAGLAQSSSTIRTVSIHLDPARTQITFKAGLLHRVSGSFALKGGVFAVDTSTGVAEGEILADATTEKSGSHELDTKLRNQTLQVETYPRISFHPEKVTGTIPSADGESHMKLTGQFTIHGTDHDLTVDVDAVRKGTDVLLKTAFIVPYVEWGMKDASIFLMHDHNIRITVVSHGTLEAPQKQS